MGLHQGFIHMFSQPSNGSSDHCGKCALSTSLFMVLFQLHQNPQLWFCSEFQVNTNVTSWCVSLLAGGP